MNDNTKLAKTSQARADNGKFQSSDYGAKSMRSMRLSDEAWQLLEDKAKLTGKTRTDIIEELAREGKEQQIIIKAIKAFIEYQESEYGINPSQKGKEFSTSTRNWAAFNKFRELIEITPWELGIDEEISPIEPSDD
jgi:predicted DNA-binding protein